MPCLEEKTTLKQSLLEMAHIRTSKAYKHTHMYTVVMDSFMSKGAAPLCYTSLQGS